MQRRSQYRPHIPKVTDNTLADTFLLVTAHPDDEVMFFSPFLAAANTAGWNIRVFCLTNGGSDGIGIIRCAELQRAGTKLGFETVCANLDGVRDGMNETWDLPVAISAISDEMASLRIAAVFTFDHLGVTKHPNHISTHDAVRQARNSLETNGRKVPLYELVTIPLLSRFLGPCGLRWNRSHIQNGIVKTTITSTSRRKGESGEISTTPTMPVMMMSDFIVRSHGFIPCSRVHTGMKIHSSQYVWWRYLWVIFSVYSYANFFVRRL